MLGGCPGGLTDGPTMGPLVGKVEAVEGPRPKGGTMGVGVLGGGMAGVRMGRSPPLREMRTEERKALPREVQGVGICCCCCCCCRRSDIPLGVTDRLGPLPPPLVLCTPELGVCSCIRRVEAWD